MGEISFTILGQPCSKANSRQIARVKNLPMVIKSKPALAYSKSFREQMPSVPEPLALPVVAHITIWYGSRRPDLDESLILDLLQVDPKKYKDNKGVILNDRQVREKHIYWRLDPANPRCEIRLEEKPDLDAPAKRGRAAKPPRLTQRGVQSAKPPIFPLNG